MFFGVVKVFDIVDKFFFGVVDIFLGVVRVMIYLGCLLFFYLCLNVDICFFNFRIIVS